MILDILYRRGLDGLYLRCLAPNEANYILTKIYEVVCGNHSSPRSLAYNVVRQRYYQTILKDATNLVGKCDKCQRHSLVLPGINMFTKSLSIRIVGARPNWPTNHDQWNQVCNCCYRLLHQMGGSWFAPLNFKSYSHRLHLVEYNLQIWIPSPFSVR